jgi:hypothetical protein
MFLKDPAQAIRHKMVSYGGCIHSEYQYLKTSPRGTTKVVYSIGKFTFKAVKVPLDWKLTHDNWDMMAISDDDSAEVWVFGERNGRREGY